MSSHVALAEVPLANSEPESDLYHQSRKESGFLLHRSELLQLPHRLGKLWRCDRNSSEIAKRISRSARHASSLPAQYGDRAVLLEIQEWRLSMAFELRTANPGF